jgi:hypothetical protein
MYACSPWARSRRTVVGAAAIVALFAVPSAHAGPLVASATNCADQVLETPFTQWADPANYVLAPNGTAENRARWTLAGGAVPALGNETYYVHAQGEQYSLALPDASSATTGSMCVGLEHPTLRFLARNDGSPFSLLHVDVLFEDSGGSVHSLAIGNVVGVARWQPTAPLPVVANLLPLLPGGYTAVAFRFTPYGAGQWSIDDVYVDPWRHG